MKIPIKVLVVEDDLITQEIFSLYLADFEKVIIDGKHFMIGYGEITKIMDSLSNRKHTLNTSNY